MTSAASQQFFETFAKAIFKYGFAPARVRVDGARVQVFRGYAGRAPASTSRVERPTRPFKEVHEMVTRAARAVNPPIFSNFVQGGQSKHPISRYMERKIRDQNNKELWRNTLTTLDTSSREEVPAYLPWQLSTYRKWSRHPSGRRNEFSRW